MNLSQFHIDRLREVIREMEQDILRGPRGRCSDRHSEDFESVADYELRKISFNRTKINFLNLAKSILRSHGVPEYNFEESLQ